MYVQIQAKVVPRSAMVVTASINGDSDKGFGNLAERTDTETPGFCFEGIKDPL